MIDIFLHPILNKSIDKYLLSFITYVMVDRNPMNFYDALSMFFVEEDNMKCFLNCKTIKFVVKDKKIYIAPKNIEFRQIEFETIYKKFIY